MYEVHVSPSLNCSLPIRHFKCSDAIKQHNLWFLHETFRYADQLIVVFSGVAELVGGQVGGFIATGGGLPLTKMTIGGY